MKYFFPLVVALIFLAASARAQEAAPAPAPAPAMEQSVSQTVASAEEPETAEETLEDTDFELPVDCTPGQDCWVVNYVDVDPSPARAMDFHCGPRTYEGHDGTDIAVLDEAAMEDGVDVYAAADGKVMRVRDDIEDAAPTEDEIKKMIADRKGCGNGILIDHGQGLQTIYCHMKKHSLAVKPGQEISAGDVIGQVGQSGAAEFPHLHFGVFLNSRVIDPFTGTDSSKGCGQAGETLWEDPEDLVYAPFSLYAAGFGGSVPDFEEIKKNASGPQSLSLKNSAALVFWAAVYGARAGDKIHIGITGPDGRVLAARDIVQDKDRARQYYYVGKKSDLHAPAAGNYAGLFTLERDLPTGPARDEIARTVRLSP